MKKLFLSAIFFFYSNIFYAQNFGVDTIYYNGNPDNRINLIIIGDGYQLNEIPKLRIDARVVADYFFSTQPFDSYRKFFNIFAIEVISNESGANHPGTAIDENPGSQPIAVVDNYLKTSFDIGGTHRCVLSNQQAIVYSVANASFPAWDYINVIINSEYYGGCAGDIAYTTMNSSAPDVFAHEFGHMFGNLSDEYGYGSTSCPQGTAQQINVSQQTDSSLLTWKRWLTTAPIPTPDGNSCNLIGLYEGAQYCDSNWYRPKCNCKMRSLFVPYCEVCYEQFIYKISTKVNYIENPIPASSYLFLCPNEQKLFSIDVLNSTDSTVRVQWFVDSVLVSNNSSTYGFNASLYSGGIHQIKAVAYDTTIHAKKQLTTYSRTWNLNVFSASVTTTDPVVFCTPDSAKLKSLRGVNYSYQWLNNNIFISGATDSVLTVKSSGNYSVIVSNGFCIDTSLQISINAKQPPVAAVVLLGNDTICKGTSVQLSATLCSSCIYQWKLNGLNIAGANQNYIIVDSSGTFNVDIIDTISSCSSFSLPQPVLLTLIDAVATSTGLTNFCENDSAILVVVPQNFNYKWYLDNILIPGAVNDSFYIHLEGNYFSIVSNGVCSDSSNSISITTDSLPLVFFSGLPDSICVYDTSFVLIGIPQGGIFLSSAMTGNVFYPDAARAGNHQVTYEYSDLNACTNQYSRNIFVDVCSGIGIINSDDEFLIYPNPAFGKIIIEYKSPEISLATIEIFDLYGKYLHTIVDNEILHGKKQQEFDCSELSSGMYLLKINSGEKNYLRRLIIMN